MARFLAVSNRKGGVGKSTIAVMLANATAAWSGNACCSSTSTRSATPRSCWSAARPGSGRPAPATPSPTISTTASRRSPRTNSAYVLNNVGDVAHARTAPGRVSLLPGSQRLEDIQGELLLKHSKKDLDADAVAVQVRTRMKNMLKHFGMDFDVVILDCPPGLSFAALAALALADHVLVPFRPDFVSQFALDRAAMLIERVETAEQLAGIPFGERRYSCLANYINGDGHERMLIEQLALDHPVLNTRLPMLDSIARAFDWDETKQTMEEKYADALPHLRSLHDEIFGAPQLRAKSA